MKLIANSMLGITSAAAAELLAAGRSVGLDGTQIFPDLIRFAPGLAARKRGFLRLYDRADPRCGGRLRSARAAAGPDRAISRR